MLKNILEKKRGERKKAESASVDANQCRAQRGTAQLLVSSTRSSAAGLASPSMEGQNKSTPALPGTRQRVGGVQTKVNRK